MEQNTKNRLITLLPWLLTFSVLGAAAFYGFYYKSGHNPFLIQPHKAELAASMQSHLLQAIEAEKNAVMAITDAASENYAGQARQAADALEVNRKDIEALIRQDDNESEVKLFSEFNVCWTQYRKLDDTILNLAVQNTNLKAQKLSSTQGAQAMRDLEVSLQHLVQDGNINKSTIEAVMPVFNALTASFNIMALHKPHIEEADDKQMDKMEQQIKAYDEIVQQAFNTLGNIDNPDLKPAKAAYGKFMEITQ